MKIAINVCFGGFGLSHKAVMRYAELSGFKLYPFTEKRKSDGGLEFGKFAPYIGQNDAFMIHYSKKPLVNEKDQEGSYFSVYEISRSDPILIRVIEELGQSANGDHAKLSIVEIPDGIEYEIDEYDGNERIAEKHRTWR